MNTILLFILILNSYNNLNAQNVSIINDKKAAEILQRISKNYGSYRSIRITFTLQLETYNNENTKIKDEKKGILWYKNNRYKLEFEQNEITCDGKTVWNLDKSNNEVQITNQDTSNNIMVSPQKLFTNFYDKDFIYRLNSKVKIDDVLCDEIELTPTNKAKLLYKVYIYTYNGEKNPLIKRIKILEKNGSRYTYSINKMKVNQNIRDDFFIFKQNGKVPAETIDLR